MKSRAQASSNLPMWIVFWAQCGLTSIILGLNILILDRLAAQDYHFRGQWESLYSNLIAKWVIMMLWIFSVGCPIALVLLLKNHPKTWLPFAIVTISVIMSFVQQIATMGLKPFRE